uniref:Uncharacterized protein n=1 Tax=Glossina austeni TaxID=7395 RepID=A0A1A9VFN7_GLOAU
MTSYSQNDNYFNEIDALSYNSRPISSTLHSYSNYDRGVAKTFFHTYDNAECGKQCSSTSNGVNYKKPFLVPMTMANNRKTFEKYNTMNVQCTMATDNLMFHHNAYPQEDSNTKNMILTNNDDDGGSGMKNDDEYECNDHWSLINSDTHDELGHTLKTLPEMLPEQPHSSSATWDGMYNRPPINCDGEGANLPSIPDVGVGIDKANPAWGKDYDNTHKKSIMPPYPVSDESDDYGLTTVCGSSIRSANKFLPVVPLRALSRPQVNACINLKRQLFEDTSSGTTERKDTATTLATISNQYNYYGDTAHIIHINSSASDYSDYCLKESRPQMAIHMHQSSFDAEFSFSSDCASIYSDTTTATTTTNIAPHKLHGLQKRRFSIIQAMTTASVIASGETRMSPQQLSKKLGGTSKSLKTSASHAIDQIYSTKDDNRETKSYICENTDLPPLVASRSLGNTTAFSSVTLATSTSILLSSSSPIVASQTPMSTEAMAVPTLNTIVKKLPKRLPVAPLTTTTRYPSLGKHLPQPPAFLLDSSSCFSKDDTLPITISTAQSLNSALTHTITSTRTKTGETPGVYNTLSFVLPTTSLTSLSSSPTSVPPNSTALKPTTKLEVTTSSQTTISPPPSSYSILTTTKTITAMETVVTTTATPSLANSFDSSTLLFNGNENKRLHFNNESSYDFTRETLDNDAKNNNNNENDFFDFKKYNIKSEETLIMKENFADEFIRNKTSTAAFASTYPEAAKTENTRNCDLKPLREPPSASTTPLTTISTTTKTSNFTVEDAFGEKNCLNSYISSTTYTTSSSNNLTFPSFFSISKPASFLDPCFVKQTDPNTIESHIDLQSSSSQFSSRDVSINNNSTSNMILTAAVFPEIATISDNEAIVLKKTFGHSNLDHSVTNENTDNTDSNNKNIYFKNDYTKYSFKSAFPDDNKGGTCYKSITSLTTAHTPPVLPLTTVVSLSTDITPEITTESSILPPISSSVTIASPCSLTLASTTTVTVNSKIEGLYTLNKSDDFVKAYTFPSTAAPVLPSITTYMRVTTAEKSPQVSSIHVAESSTLNNSCPIITTTKCSTDVMMSSSLTSLYTNSLPTTNFRSEVQQTTSAVTTTMPLLSKSTDIQVFPEVSDTILNAPTEGNSLFYAVNCVTDANCNATTSEITTDVIRAGIDNKPSAIASKSEVPSSKSSPWDPHKSATATTTVVAGKASNLLDDFSKGLKDGLDGLVISGRTTSSNQKQSCNTRKSFGFSFPSKLVPNVGNLLSGGNKHISTTAETTASSTAMSAFSSETLAIEHSTISTLTTTPMPNNSDLKTSLSNTQTVKEECGGENNLSLDEKLLNNNICITTYEEDNRKVEDTEDLHKTLQSSTFYHVTSSDDYDKAGLKTFVPPFKSATKLYDVDKTVTENDVNFGVNYDRNGYVEDQRVAGPQSIDGKQGVIALTTPSTLVVSAATTETMKTTKKTKNILSSLSQVASQIPTPPTTRTAVSVTGPKPASGGMFGTFLGKAAAAVQSATQAVNQGASIASAVVQKVPNSNNIKGEQQTHQLIPNRETIPATTESTGTTETTCKREVILEQQHIHSPYSITSDDSYENSNLQQLNYEQNPAYQTNDHQNQHQMKYLPTVPVVASTGKKLPIINPVKSGYLIKQQPTETYDTDEEDVLITDKDVDIRHDLNYDVDNEQHEYNITSQKLTKVLDDQRVASHLISSYYEHANGGYDYRDDYFNEEDEYKYLQIDENNKQRETQEILRVDNGNQFYISPKEQPQQQPAVYQKSLQYSDEDVRKVETSLDYVDDMYPSEDSGNYLDESSSGSVTGIYPSSTDKINRSLETEKHTTQSEDLVVANLTTTLANQLQAHQQIRKQNSIIMEEDELSSIVLSDKSGVSPAKSLSRKSSNILLMDDVDDVQNLNMYPGHQILQIRKNKLTRGETEEVVSGHMQIPKRKPEITARQRWHWAFNKIIIQLNVSKQ